MNFYVIKFGQYFYRKDDEFMNAVSLNVTRSLQDSWWFGSYESAKRTSEKFGGEVKEECNENSDPHKIVNHNFLEGFNYALANVQALEETEVNDNQKIVLEWLKNEISENDLQYTLWSFTEDVYEKLEIGAGLAPYIEAWEKLKEKQKFEVLAVFAQWVLKQEEAE